jgi:hypothetical protein
MPPLLPLIAAGAPLLAGAFGFAGGERANAANAQQAQKNRDFQERMSNTSYQRATEDMRAAGLNPALAYQQGGASQPTGSTAQMQNVEGPAATSAIQTAQIMASILATKAAVQKTQEETTNLVQERNIGGNLYKQRDMPIGLQLVEQAIAETQSRRFTTSPEYLAAGLANLQSQTDASRASATERRAEANAKGLTNRALLQQGLEKIRDSQAWNKIMSSFESTASDTNKRLNQRWRSGK